jgi:hypothetical protein
MSSAMNIKAPKKLIEVALPLDDINVASAREKSIRRGHPMTLHLWWARRPLATARAVLFAQLVNRYWGVRVGLAWSILKRYGIALSLDLRRCWNRSPRWVAQGSN